MIMTEQQRRWWFATHPEYSWSRSGAGSRRHHEGHDEDEDTEKFSPEDVDAYVDEALKYERDDVVITLLKATKFWFGTEFASKTPAEQHRLLWGDEESAESDDQPADETDEKTEATTSKEVDASTDEAPKHLDGPVADLLKSGKRIFGIEKDSRTHAGLLGNVYEPPPLSGDKGSEGGEDAGPSSFSEAVLEGMQRQFEAWERLLGVSLGLSNPSRHLGRNMIKDGKPWPGRGWAAHHIVPFKDDRFLEAGEARRVLEKLGVGLNESPNGVWLPCKPGLFGAYHPALHTRENYRQVLRLLRKTGTRDDAIRVLKDIGQALSEGTFGR